MDKQKSILNKKNICLNIRVCLYQTVMFKYTQLCFPITAVWQDVSDEMGKIWKVKKNLQGEKVKQKLTIFQ